MAAPTITTGIPAFIPNYWDSVLGQNLYPNLFLYGFGTKRTVPSNFGVSIKIPRLKKQNIVAVRATEGAIVGTCPLSSQFVSGTLKQFAGAYKHSDIVIMTALSDVVELSLRDIARDLAKQMDTHVRDVLSGIGTRIGGGGALATSVATANTIKASDLLKAVVLLEGAENPRPPDGHFPFIAHPYQTYSLQTSLTGNSWLEINKSTSDTALANLYRSEIGRLFGARVLTSTNMKRSLTGLQGISNGASGFIGYMFAPDAYYVTEISEMTAKTFIKPLGSAGTADPANQQASVAAKVFFTAIPANWGSEVRMIRIASGGRTPT